MFGATDDNDNDGEFLPGAIINDDSAEKRIKWWRD